MRSRTTTRTSIPTPAPVSIQALIWTAVVVTIVLVLIGCQAPGSGTGASATPSAGADAGLADRLEKLPVLPAEIAATLDPKTSATKSAGPPPVPVKATGPRPLAPCCSIKDQKSLKVNVPLTVCRPLRDFIVAPISDLVMAREGGGAPGGSGAAGGPAGAAGARGDVKAYKLDKVNRADIWNTIVCITSTGPFDATFIEDRSCVNYAPVDSLFVSAWGDLHAWYWNGGAANHPPEVTVASCRNVGTFRLPCGGPGTCPCDSSPCPADQPCSCDPPW